jgi:hypothetical protein
VNPYKIITDPDQGGTKRMGPDPEHCLL